MVAAANLDMFGTVVCRNIPRSQFWVVLSPHHRGSFVRSLSAVVLLDQRLSKAWLFIRTRPLVVCNNSLFSFCAAELPTH